MKQVLVVDLKKCTGCRNCELACSVRNTRSFNPSRSRIQVLKDEVKNLLLPMVCLQCEEPLCQDACPNGAIVENSTEVLTVKEDVCVGCLNCATACIYGGITLDPYTQKAVKCDLCDGDPACVAACEYGAISVIEQKRGAKERREATLLATQKIGLIQEDA